MKIKAILLAVLISLGLLIILTVLNLHFFPETEWTSAIGFWCGVTYVEMRNKLSK